MPRGADPTLRHPRGMPLIHINPGVRARLRYYQRIRPVKAALPNEACC
jgi:hypothetical protein